MMLENDPLRPEGAPHPLCRFYGVRAITRALAQGRLHPDTRLAFLNVKHLPPERILLGRRITTESGLFGLLARSLCDGDPRLEPKVRDRLARRHDRRPVTLGAGLALPHAAVPGLTGTRAVFVRTPTPVRMGVPDEAGVTDVLGLLVPSPGLPADYDLLMALTAWLTRPECLAALRAARTTRQILAVLTGEVPG